MDPKLPDLASLARLWNVTIERQLSTFSSEVAFGRQDDRPVVLKLPRVDGDEAGQMAMLRHFDGRGAVRLIAAEGSGMLLERIVPGETLAPMSLAGRDDEATRIFADVAAALHGADGPLDGFRTVDDLARGFDRYRASGDRQIAPDRLADAAKLYDALAATQEPAVLLHGDLHHDNILLDDAGRGIAIDPKGYVGESEFEAGAWLRNPMAAFSRFATTEVLQRRLGILSERLGGNRDRMTGWAYAQAILSAIWSIEDGHSPQASLATAEALRPLL